VGKVVIFKNIKGGINMPSVFDVANFFISWSIRNGDSSITHLKLQKLVYYAQVWSLVWDKEELFSNEFKAWVHGPVCEELFQKYKDYGSSEITIVDDRYNENVFSDYQRATLEQVWEMYGDYSGEFLREMTHSERPWKRARRNCSNWERGNELITKESIINFYSQYYK